MKFHQYFRIAVLTEIQNRLFAVDTMNRGYVYDIENNYKEITRFMLSYNVLIAIKPHYFITSSVISNIIDIYDSNNIKIVKKI